MTINNWEQWTRRDRPPSSHVPQIVVGVVAVSVLLGIVGSVSAAGLADRAPLTLMLLNPSDRHLLIAADEMATSTFFVTGFVRQMVFDPFAFLVGFWFGHRVVDLFARRGRSPATARRRFERLATVLVIVSPNTAISMLAGASSMSFRRFLALNAIGTLLHLALINWLADRFSTQIEQVVDAVATFELPLTVAAVAAVLWTIRQGRRGDLRGAYDGRVAIIGAGVAGLVAARELHERGAQVTVFEARSAAGGRLVSTDDIAGLALDLGPEWLEEPEQLDRIIGSQPTGVGRISHYPDGATYAIVDGGLRTEALDDADEQHFVDTTWAQLVNDTLVRSVVDLIITDCEIIEVDHRDATIRLLTASGEVHEADRLIVTAPIRALKDDRIKFTPPLPDAKTEAIDAAPVWGGVKVLLEFADRFYPTFLDAEHGDTSAGHRYYSDAVVCKPTTANVLAFVAIGPAARPYVGIDDTRRRDLILAELDELFGGAATRSYLRHVTQDWSSEPFIHQAHLADHAPAWISRELWEPVDDRIFFAGEAATRHGDWGGVDDAATSALDVVDIVLQSPQGPLLSRMRQTGRRR